MNHLLLLPILVDIPKDGGELSFASAMQLVCWNESYAIYIAKSNQHYAIMAIYTVTWKGLKVNSVDEPVLILDSEILIAPTEFKIVSI